MGRIGSTEMNLILDKFGITEIFSGLIDITGSKNKNSLTQWPEENLNEIAYNGLYSHRASYINES